MFITVYWSGNVLKQYRKFVLYVGILRYCLKTYHVSALPPVLIHLSPVRNRRQRLCLYLSSISPSKGTNLPGTIHHWPHWTFTIAGSPRPISSLPVTVANTLGLWLDGRFPYSFSSPHPVMKSECLRIWNHFVGMGESHSFPSQAACVVLMFHTL